MQTGNAWSYDVLTGGTWLQTIADSQHRATHDMLTGSRLRMIQTFRVRLHYADGSRLHMPTGNTKSHIIQVAQGYMC